MKKWTKEEMEQQRDEILSEFNFHEVLDFCNALLDMRKELHSIKYKSVSEVREEARMILDSFIKSYLKEDCYSSYYNGKWDVCMSGCYDGETPLLSLAFKHEVTEADAWLFCERQRELKKIINAHKGKKV